MMFSVPFYLFAVCLMSQSHRLHAFSWEPSVTTRTRKDSSRAMSQSCRTPSSSPLSTSWRTRSPTILQESNQPDYETEETLLQMRLAVTKPDLGVDEAKQIIVKYCQSFPFAAVLPVQPLKYLPASDEQGDGVELTFLRKKTDTKSGQDGGIRFFVTLTDDNDGLHVTAKRNSIGQTIRKVHAERVVVTCFVAGISGQETERYGKAPLDVVQVTSLFHLWM